jgi:hypothetical protein
VLGFGGILIKTCIQPCKRGFGEKRIREMKDFF